MELHWYSHRLSDPNPVFRAVNLSDAKRRFRVFSEEYRERGVRLWAPWIELAEVGVDEDEAWLVIEICLRRCQGIVLDLDGDDEPSPGIIRERKIAEAVGAKVEVVR